MLRPSATSLVKGKAASKVSWLPDQRTFLMMGTLSGRFWTAEQGEEEPGAVATEVRRRGGDALEAGGVGDILVAGLDGLAVVGGQDLEGGEDGNLDRAKVAAARDDEALEHGEGERRDVGGQERLLRRLAGQQDPVEAVLLALLADHTGDRAGGAVISVLGKQLDDILQGGKDDGGEGLGQRDGVLDVVDAEVVLARRGTKALNFFSTFCALMAWSSSCYRHIRG